MTIFSIPEQNVAEQKEIGVQIYMMQKKITRKELQKIKTMLLIFSHEAKKNC